MMAKIEYMENPLRSIVIIDPVDLEKIKKHLEEEYSDYPAVNHQELLKEYVKSLTDIHYGDCCCVPMTCSKCMAEYALGIDTLVGLGKHEAYYIFCEFGSFVDEHYQDTKTIDQVIDSLSKEKDYSDVIDPRLVPHIPRWKQQRKNAHDWLVRYKKEFLP